jgi:hypothetical protein
MAFTATNADQLLQTLTDEIAKLYQHLKASEEKLARPHGNHNNPSGNDPMATTIMITDIKKKIANLDATIDNLAVETQQVMIVTNKSSVNTKMEGSLSSDTPEVITAVSNSLFAAPPALQLPLLPCPDQIFNNGYAPAINFGAPSVNSSSSPLLADAQHNSKESCPKEILTSTQSSNRDRRSHLWHSSNFCFLTQQQITRCPQMQHHNCSCHRFPALQARPQYSRCLHHQHQRWPSGCLYLYNSCCN